MADNISWETFASTGSHVGWGTKPGQHVTGCVVDYDQHGGTDYNDAVVPQIVVALTDKAYSFAKNGSHTIFPAGETVTVTCSQVSLKNVMRQTNPTPGDLLRIRLVDVIERNGKTMKIFEIDVARGQGMNGVAAVQAAPVSPTPAPAAPAAPAPTPAAPAAPAPANPNVYDAPAADDDNFDF
ncbi:hypothetical protein KIH27_02115 [Mycobacterium sp. M1]|uniref:Uncharacterized protein n=1 Tax=Mycolicibacter acidiphilus TaxID=2835306 RepID=A0ABS5RDN0_9MYCO|nr:hypothetical protein [Mycolicibacter acidiphilus]MBS9532380.1 hypothetical protein [Mycolicibacter acidiphilus]